MSLTLDGKRPEELGLKLLQEHQHPVLPDTRDRSVEIPGKHGAYDFGADLGVRPFELPFMVNQFKKVDVQQKVREFTRLLVNPDGRPKTIPLIFDYEPDKSYSVRYTGSLPIDRLVRMGEFVLPLTAFDPYAYALANAYDPKEDYQYDVNNYGEGYYENTQSFKWEYSNHYSGVHNYSYYETELILTIQGTVTNPSITHLETGTILTLPSINNETMVINSSNFTVKVGEVNSLVGTDFIKIISGDNGFLFEGENPNATVTYQWKHKFL
jgi:phage-related protein